MSLVIRGLDIDFQYLSIVVESKFPLVYPLVSTVQKSNLTIKRLLWLCYIWKHLKTNSGQNYYGRVDANIYIFFDTLLYSVTLLSRNVAWHSAWAMWNDCEERKAWDKSWSPRLYDLTFTGIKQLESLKWASFQGNYAWTTSRGSVKFIL